MEELLEILEEINPDVDYSTSFATVRLLISRDTFKNLSSLIFFSLCLRSVPASKGSFSLKAKKWILQPQNPLCYHNLILLYIL